MTTEEIKQYIADNEPTDTKRDSIGRWTERIWATDSTTIIEMYIYKYTVSEVEADPYSRRDSYAVLSTDLKEVYNG